MKRLISFITSFAVIMTLFVGISPVNAEDKEGITGQGTEFIEFGSYPQTEIVGEASQSGAYGQSYEAEGDYVVDENLYATLEEESGWDINNDKIVSEKKYHRIKIDDVTSVYTSGMGLDDKDVYNWSDDITYHYFRYDPIKWRVLESDDDEAFLLSEIALDDIIYEETSYEVTWKTCTLRSWLNGYGASSNKRGKDYSSSNFSDRAFTDSEQSAIIEKTIKNAGNKYYGTAGGSNTTDKIFLLSESEVYGDDAIKYGFASNYYIGDKARQAKSSTYAKAMGIHSESLGNCKWYLRSPGGDRYNVAMFVMDDGSVEISGSGSRVDYFNYFGIRPALHLNLKAKDQYTIKKHDVDIDADDVIMSDTEFEYDGTAKTPSVNIPGKVQGLDYKVEYLNNTNLGTATVKVIGIGDCKGAITKEFNISLPNLSESGALSKYVSYDLIEFGSYPQTEIVGTASQSGVNGKSWEVEGDYDVDAILYTTLQEETDWTNNDKIVLGKKYHRIKVSDVTLSDNDSGYYNWSDDSVYHYFRYDPIKWRVLSRDDDDIFLISEKALDSKEYNEIDTIVTWETCTLRTWLNNVFINCAFTKEEQAAIIEKTIENKDNERYRTEGGNDTTDKVFLLSESEVYGDEAVKYGFASSNPSTGAKSRQATSSTYAKAMGVWTDTRKSHLGNCYWSLRSSGCCDDIIYNNVYVDSNGYVDSYGGFVFIGYAVRPVLHLNPESTNLYKNAGITDGVATFENKEIDLGSVYPKVESTVKPKVSIVGLVEGTDYTVSYENNDKIGIATVVVTGKGEWSGTLKKEFAIVDKVDISSMEIELLDKNIIYKGEACCPEIKVGNLVEDQDYTVEYSNNTGAGIGKIRVTGKSSNGYTGTIEKNFTIYEGKSIKNKTISISKNSYDYTGSVIKPAVTIDGLTEGTDFEVSYSNNTNPGTATITVTGIGSWYGTATKTFIINSLSLSGKTVNLSPSSYTYDGSAKEPGVTITGLTKDTDYTVAYSNNVNAGTATVTVTGKGAYSGTLTKTFTIDKASVSGKTITLSPTSYTYDGSAKEPQVTITGLIKGTDFEVSYTDNKNAGEATVTVTGKGNYDGSVTKTFEISKASISAKTVTLSPASYTYDGSEKKPSVSIDGLTSGTDFTAAYTDNKNAGTATVTVTGKGNYTGIATKTFTISKASISDRAVSLSPSSFEYDGDAKEPKVSIEGLVNGTDYEVSYSNNRNVGTGTVTVTGKGNFTGTLSKTFEIYQSSLSGNTITLAATSYTYDGTEKKPAVTIEGLTEGVDFTVSYTDNINAGIATATITRIGSSSETATKVFTINPANISGKTATLAASTYTYDGSEKKPAVSIEGLKEGTDYTVTYEDNISIGTAKVTITGKGNYTGNITKTFTITEESISGKTISLASSEYTYDGNEKKPAVTITGLTEGTDYSVTYADNVNAGTATITVSGKGNYDGSVTKSFTINPANITAKTITLGASTYTYDGSEKKPAVTVEGLKNGTDYEVIYSNNKNVGTATATITGKGNYTGSASKNFIIDQASIADKGISLSPSSYEYDGTEKKPAVIVEGLTEGTDYEVSYADNTNIGTATVTVTGKGNYTGKATKTFGIYQNSISDRAMTLSATSYTYNGSAKEPEVTVEGLVNGTDYKVDYSDNVNAGTATVTVTGIGMYGGSITKEFTIKRASLSGKTAKLSKTAYVYSGKANKPGVTISGLKKGTDFTVTYSSNTKCGKAKVVIKGSGNYSGSITKYFNTKPAKSTIQKVTVGEGTIKIKVKGQKDTGVTGYQYYYKKSGASAKTVYETLATKKLKGLKSGKKYTVKVRAYKTIDGKKVYGAYSKSKTVKVK